MAGRVYTAEIAKSALVLPDVTIIPAANTSPARFIVVQSEQKIFYEAANSLDRAIELMEALTDVKEKALNDAAYSPSAKDFAKFGVPSSAMYITQAILQTYAKLTREKKGRVTPGVQYDLHAIRENDIQVGFGNYGIFFATLVQATKNPAFKQQLIDAGEQIFGSRQAFFVNPPATNTVVLSKDGYILLVNRGPTAEYPYMLHQVAAGHHSPDKTKLSTNIVELDELVGYQISTETGLGPASLRNLQFLGMAFSTGYRIEGTEKVEVLTKAQVPFTAQEIWQSIQERAPHRWETRSLYAIREKDLPNLMFLTLDANTGLHFPTNTRTFGKTATVGRDPAASGRWVPVGAATMILAGGEPVLRALPSTYQPLPAPESLIL